MSKTFASSTNIGTEVFVGEGITVANYQLIIREIGASIGKAGIYLPSSDAPALALAILEAAGVEKVYRDSADYGTQDFMEMYAYDLEKHIEERERITAEAKEQAELEAEALELFNANKGTELDDWKYADRSVVSSWVRVARKAREMRAEK